MVRPACTLCTCWNRSIYFVKYEAPRVAKRWIEYPSQQAVRVVLAVL